MHPPPTAEVIGLGGSDHQQAADGSIKVENPENGENQHENSENKHENGEISAKIFEVSPDPA